MSLNHFLLIQREIISQIKDFELLLCLSNRLLLCLNYVLSSDVYDLHVK